MKGIRPKSWSIALAAALLGWTFTAGAAPVDGDTSPGAKRSKAPQRNPADDARSIARIVQTVESMAPPQRTTVEQLLDVTLASDPADLTSDPYSLAGKPRSGPFFQVEYREPGKDKRYGLWILSFEVRAGIVVRPRDFSKELLGRMRMRINPHEKNRTYAYVRESASGTVFWTFGLNSGSLTSITIQRNLNPPDFEP
jgi:hypothetical protein